jgi:hypothetical protein
MSRGPSRANTPRQARGPDERVDPKRCRAPRLVAAVVRLIPSRYPTVGLYDAIADPADLDVVFAIEALANPRIREEIGELSLVPKEERLTGPARRR